ncbi:MAG: HD-GYP domain-containing protein, partial [Lachnospiraceae bacterium]|nr:HD-GYP domain-containing protein [Lachnospiraceae bacterium]
FLVLITFNYMLKNISHINKISNQNENLEKAKNEIKTLSVEVMEALAHTIDAKDEYTKGHSIRVARYSKMIAEKLGLSDEECENIYYMGLLHDLGKIGVPNEIINSPNPLTDEQYEIIKTHPGLGFEILSEIKSRPDLSIGARWHHERFDGKGYPDRKSGEEIPLMARIISVADSYDAMTSNRSYRNYMAQDRVIEEIKNNKGTQFDPKIAECMISIINDDADYTLHE